MRIGFTTFLVLSFVGLALFGFWGMAHDISHKGECLAEMVMRTKCHSGDPLAFLNFHLSALKQFSTLIFVNIVFLLSLLLVLVLKIGLQTSFSLKNTTLLLVSLFLRSLGLEFVDFLSRKKFIRWLALKEHSPAFFEVF